MNVLPIGPDSLFLMEGLLVASFVIVPSAVLLGASRLRWIASRPWSLLIAGPIALVAGYVGLCYCAVELGGI